MKEENPEHVIAANAISEQVYALDWRGWLKQHASRLLLFARQQTRNQHDAEDAMQEALVKLARKVDEGTFVGGQESWLPFLYTQIRREAIDRGRKNDRRTRREEAVIEDARSRGEFQTGGWFEEEDGGSERAELLESALKELPEKFAEVVIMKIWGDRTFDEIGRALGISLNTAASRYRYGIDALRKKLATPRIRGDI